MLELPHTLVGATIATKIPYPLISLPLAFFSHFLIDLLPHWNPHLYTETKKSGFPTKTSKLIVVADVIASLIVGGMIAYRALPNTGAAITILLACFAAVVVDVVEGFYFFLGIRSKFLEKLIEFQLRYQSRAPFIPGLLTQIAVVVIAFIILNS